MNTVIPLCAVAALASVTTLSSISNDVKLIRISEIKYLIEWLL